VSWNEQIPIHQDHDDAAPHIVEMMAAVDVELDADAVHLLISQARLAHRRALSHWLRENEPQFMAPLDRGRPYAQWENRRRKNPGRMRDGSDLPKAPLTAIYFLTNRFYRRELGLKFNPDFRSLRWDEDFTFHEKLSMLKGPALFFVLIAQSVDWFNYTAERCKRVHDTHYRLLDRRIP
jgi:hypothetical protein